MTTETNFRRLVLPVHGKGNSDTEIKLFQQQLLAWFKGNRRFFSWRETNLSDYQLFFSEVLSQRTKAETVYNYLETNRNVKKMVILLIIGSNQNLYF